MYVVLDEVTKRLKVFEHKDDQLHREIASLKQEQQLTHDVLGNFSFYLFFSFSVFILLLMYAGQIVPTTPHLTVVDHAKAVVRYSLSLSFFFFVFSIHTRINIFIS